jgi:hypothetical protein
MTSAAQVSANRTNAQKSTGPRTPEGKAAVAQNAVRHGLLARAAVLQGEDPEEFAEYREQVLEDLHADGTLEVVLAERVVSLSWRLQRAARNQNAAFEALYDKHTGDPQALLPAPEPAPGLDPGVPAGDGATIGRMLVQDFAQEKVLERLLMYERRIESSLYRTIAQLEKRQRLRGAAPSVSEPVRSVPARAYEEVSSLKSEVGGIGGFDAGLCSVDTSHLQLDTAAEPPSGVATNGADAQGQLCETKPIVGGIGVQGSGASDLTPDTRPLTPELSCETNPISEDPNAGQPTAGGVPPSCGAEADSREAETDSAKQDACDKSRKSGVRTAFRSQYRRLFRAAATFVGRIKQSQFVANCLPDHGLRAGGTLGTAIS